MKKKATNKQILDAYGQSYKLMQEAKRKADEKRNVVIDKTNLK